MKINEIVQLTGPALVEHLEENNSTGCSAQDLAKVVESHRANEWDDAVDGEEYLAQLSEGKKPWL